MGTIQVLGVKDHKGTEVLLSNVKKALCGLNLRLEPYIVDNVNHLMGYKIDGIPALVVRGEVISQLNVPDTNSLQLFFKNIFLPEQIPFAMKNILVPTDFSETSKSVFSYAKALANKANAGLKAMHVHYPAVSAADAYPTDLYSEIIEMKEKKLQRLICQDPAAISDGDLMLATKVKAEIAIGFPGEVIVRRSKDEDVDYIVMGTTGESGLFEKVFGSISSHVARKAHCPVLLVPKGVKFQECKNILFATNHQSTDEALLERIPEVLLGCPNANVHFVHINKPEGNKYSISDLRFQKPVLPGQFHFVEIENSDVFEGLNQYAKVKNIDALVMATSHRTFFEELFHKSLTKQMALNANMPLLVMHYDD